VFLPPLPSNIQLVSFFVLVLVFVVHSLPDSFSFSFSFSLSISPADMFVSVRQTGADLSILPSKSYATSDSVRADQSPAKDMACTPVSWALLPCSTEESSTTTTTTTTPSSPVPHAPSVDEERRIQAMLGGAQRQRTTLLYHERNVRRTLPASADRPQTLLILGCQNCHVEVHCRLLKLCLQDCRNCLVTVHGRLLTSTCELFRCRDIHLQLHQPALGFQLDQCHQVQLWFQSVDFFQQVVWAGCSRLQVRFGQQDSPALSTGFHRMRRLLDRPDLSPLTDQFLVRMDPAAGPSEPVRLRCERLLRLDSGYPTTSDEQLRHQRIEAQLHRAVQWTEDNIRSPKQ
jgi:hypothetical protein